MSYNDENLRRMLAQNEAMQRESHEHDEAIRRSAEEELGRIDARMMSMPAGQVASDSALAFEYRRLVEDRGRLLRVVSGF